MPVQAHPLPVQARRKLARGLSMPQEVHPPKMAKLDNNPGRE